MHSVAGEDSLDVTIYSSLSDSTSSYSLAALGDWAQITTSAGETLRVQSTGPTLVSQYRKTGRYHQTTTHWVVCG